MINVEHNKQYSPGLLLLNCFWAIIFFYFAMHLDSDPITCEASDENDYRFAAGVTAANKEPRYIDVGFQLRLVMRIAFLSYTSMVAIGLLSYCTQSDVCRKGLFLVLALMNYAVMFAWIFLFYVRIQHSGKVCSGDFLDETDSREGFLIQQGLFVKYAMVSFLTLFALAVTLVLVKVFKSPLRHPDNETELERI